MTRFFGGVTKSKNGRQRVLRCAQNDNFKKANAKDKYRGLSTALRFGRDDSVEVEFCGSPLLLDVEFVAFVGGVGGVPVDVVQGFGVFGELHVADGGDVVLGAVGEFHAGGGDGFEGDGVVGVQLGVGVVERCAVGLAGYCDFEGALGPGPGEGAVGCGRDGERAAGGVGGDLG